MQIFYIQIYHTGDIKTVMLTFSHFKSLFSHALLDSEITLYSALTTVSDVSHRHQLMIS